MNEAKFFDLIQLQQTHVQSSRPYREFLRTPAMSAGIFVLSVGANDPQAPHREDELYYIVGGRAHMQIELSGHDGNDCAISQAVQAGSIIYVSANVKHHFFQIEEELTVLVFFAPAETTRNYCAML